MSILKVAFSLFCYSFLPDFICNLFSTPSSPVETFFCIQERDYYNFIYISNASGPTQYVYLCVFVVSVIHTLPLSPQFYEVKKTFHRPLPSKSSFSDMIRFLLLKQRERQIGILQNACCQREKPERLPTQLFVCRSFFCR